MGTGIGLTLKLWGGPLDGCDLPVEDCGRREAVVMRTTDVPGEIEHLIYDYDLGTYDPEEATIVARFREAVLWKGDG